MTNAQIIEFAELLFSGVRVSEAFRRADPVRAAILSPTALATEARRLRASQRCQLALALLEKHCEF